MILTVISCTNKRIDNLHIALISYMDGRIADLRREYDDRIAEIKDSLAFTQVEMDALKRNATPTFHGSQRKDTHPEGLNRREPPVTGVSSVAGDSGTTALSSIESRLDRLQAQVTTLEQKMDYSEIQSRRSNVRIDGIPERRGETWDQTEALCKAIFSDSLGLNDLKIERAHHNGPKKNDKPRSIIIKFLSFKDREAVLAKAKERHPAGIFINPDFSSLVARIRKELKSQVQTHRAQGNDAYISFDRIRIRKKVDPNARGNSGGQPKTAMHSAATSTASIGDHTISSAPSSNPNSTPILDQGRATAPPQPKQKPLDLADLDAFPPLSEASTEDTTLVKTIH